jgi:glycosyltransferase involved in cell wall biosynthesis
MCKHLKLLGNSVTIICLNTKHVVVSKYPEVEDAILSIRQPPPRSVYFWLKLPLIQRMIKKLIGKIRPNGVVANIFPCQYLLPNTSGITRVWYCHEPSAYIHRNHSIRNLSAPKSALINSAKMFLGQYDRYKVKNIDKIACNSYFTANLVRQIYRRDPVVIYPGVDTARFRPVATKKLNPAILFCVGPLLKSKRLDLILYATHILSIKHNFRVVIAGDGPEYMHLVNLANALGVSNLVEFRGRIPEDDLIRLYSEAIAVVYPSIEEPFGLVPLEAMACGTPVIACKPGGTSETIIDGKTGFLVDYHNIKQLVEKIDFILSNPLFAEEMGLLARRRTMQKFSWRRAAEELSELCKSQE